MDYKKMWEDLKTEVTGDLKKFNNLNSVERKVSYPYEVAAKTMLESMNKIEKAQAPKKAEQKR